MRKKDDAQESTKSFFRMPGYHDIRCRDSGHGVKEEKKMQKRMAAVDSLPQDSHLKTSVVQRYSGSLSASGCS